MRAKDVYVADFETTTCQPPRVWLAGFTKVGELEKFNYQNNIDDFMTFFLYKKNEVKIYFHNLTFDGQFIMWWLEDKGFVCDMRYAPVELGHYTVLIDENSQIFFIKIMKPDKTILYIYDSFKLYRNSLKKLAIDFDLKYKKGEIDYSRHNNRRKKITKEELEYFKRDLFILSELMSKYYKQFNKIKMTISGQALQQFKLTLPVYKFKLPELNEYEDDFIRGAYRGGICYVNKKIKNKVIKCDGACYDFNSMYPSMLHSSSGNYYPIGKPSVMGGFQDLINCIKKQKLFIIKCSCKYKIKENRLPCISGLRSRFGEGDIWEEDSKGHTILHLTNIDLKLLINNYVIQDFVFIDGFYWEYKEIGLFDKYVNKWYNIKKTTTNLSQRNFAKMMLNSLIGKMGQRLIFTKKIYTLNGKNKKMKGHLYAEQAKGEYLPIPVFCNAYARAKLAEVANDNYENFLYCDTDSLHLKSPAQNIKIGEELQEWKVENKIVKCKFIKQKVYIEKIENKKYIIKCAGLSEESRPDTKNDSIFKMFGLNKVFKNGRRAMVRVAGGAIIKDFDYTIN